MAQKIYCNEWVNEALDEHVKNIFDILMNTESDDDLWQALQDYGDGVYCGYDTRCTLHETELAERFRQVVRICDNASVEDISRVTGEALLRWELPAAKVADDYGEYHQNFFLIEIVRQDNGKWEIRNIEFVLYKMVSNNATVALDGLRLAIIADAAKIAAAGALQKYEHECKICTFS